jgi:hypothetical protein
MFLKHILIITNSHTHKQVIKAIRVYRNIKFHSLMYCGLAEKKIAAAQKPAAIAGFYKKYRCLYGDRK